jgi:hypothetical protein
VTLGSAPGGGLQRTFVAPAHAARGIPQRWSSTRTKFTPEPAPAVSWRGHLGLRVPESGLMSGEGKRKRSPRLLAVALALRVSSTPNQTVQPTPLCVTPPALASLDCQESRLRGSWLTLAFGVRRHFLRERSGWLGDLG